MGAMENLWEIIRIKAISINKKWVQALAITAKMSDKLYDI